MEPAAPGTEDDPVCTQESQEFKPTKKDAAEEQALSKKAFLPNGTYGNIFLLEYVQGAQHWYCRVCERPVFGQVFNHELGKRHLTRLKLGKNDDDNEDDDEEKKIGGPGMGMVVAPGEPLPPGFEGEMEETKTIIQERLDKFNVPYPLVGLEYLLELMDCDPSKEPSYMCILCHKKGDPRTIMTHLASYNHQLTYLQKHFPTAYRHIAPYMVKGYKRNWQNALLKIVEAVESTFGRLKPIQVDAAKYNKDQMYYVEMVAKGKHFSELLGHTFENVVSKEELSKIHEIPKGMVATPVVNNTSKRKSPSPPVVAKPIKRQKAPVEVKLKKRSLSPVSDVSSSDLEDFDPKSPKKFNKGYESSRRGKPGVDRNSFSKREGNMPWQKSSYRKDRPPPVADRNKDEKTEKIEEFKRLAKAIDNQMEQVLKKHKENPEKHPKYNDEWKKFWNARYKELQSEGKNAATHDFKPEWIEFWNKRMLELHQEEIRTSKIALRKRLGLPEEPAPISFKIGERRKPVNSNNKPIPTAAQPDNDPEVIIIDDNDEDASIPKERNRSRSPNKRKGHSPQFRRRSPAKRRDSPPIRRKDSPPPISRRKDSPSPPSYRNRSLRSKDSLSPISRRKDSLSPPSYRNRSLRSISPPSRRRDSPLSRRRDMLGSSRRESPPVKKKDSPKRQVSPFSRRRSSPTYDRAPSPPQRIKEDKLSPSRDRSPRREKFEKSRDRSEERSRGKSREISWERERERRRDYDEKHWDRPYRGREYPWELEHHYPFNANPYAPPKILRDVTRKPVINPGSPYIHSQESDFIEDDGDVNIVAVLRLLTALEEKLGSLGPKVIDLLAQALAMEKKLANSSEELLDSEINCVLFETVKEKLKGQLQAGLVDWIQEKAFKTAIKKTASLIHVASERKKQKEQELPKKPVVVPGIGKVDKGKIARQIANALIAQGKTDVTQNELEQLINAVVGIAEAQKNSSETLTTASFLEKLSKGPLEEIEKVESKEVAEQEVVSEPKVDSEPIVKEEKDAALKPEEDHEGSNCSQDKTIINMEGLSDSDLETLLQNFKDLSSDEQLGLINYLKKLEAKEPERVEKLRKFVNLSEISDEKKDNERYSPFSAKIEATSSIKENAEEKKTEMKEDNNTGLVNIDSEDEYSFEDVAKAVSQKVKENEKEKEQKRLEDKNLDDAKAFITSLMSSLNKNVATVASSTTASLVSPSVSTINKNPTEKINIVSNIPVSSVDIAKSLSGITMSVSSLGNILGNVQSLTNMSLAGVEPKIDSQVQSTNFSNAPLIDSLSTAKNPYNEFDISSQRDSKNKPELAKGRTNKSYDEFNIGPIPHEIKDDMRDVRMHGPMNSTQLHRPLVYSDLSSSANQSFPGRLSQPDVKAPYSNIPVAPMRGNPIQDKPSPPFPNQYSQRGPSFPNKIRPGSNNFELGSGRGDIRPRSTDFRGGMSDGRGGSSNFGGMTTDFRLESSDYRGGPNDYRDGPNDNRDSPNDQRDAPNNYRDVSTSYRDLPGSYRDVPSSYRDAPNSYRDSLNDYKDSPNDYRNSPNDYRNAPNEYRSGPPTNRGNDFRDSRIPQGNIQGAVDDSRIRGGFGYTRGHKSGNFNYGNRSSNFTPRYPQSNSFNPYNKW